MKSVLVSVSDKTGIVEFCQALVKLGYQIITTGGTYQLLSNNMEHVVEVKEVTSFEEMLDGRVKTLHPLIHGGILYKRDNPEHVNTIEKHGIHNIEIVVNNLYPFEEMLHNEMDHETMIENIDIGGPSLIRAAAKNHHDVLIVTHPSDYQEVIERLQNNQNTLAFRQELARKAFSLTAYYDGLIAAYFNDLGHVRYPDYLSRPLKLKESMRYGENPHQKASFYEDGYLKSENHFDFKQLHGKEISFNNLNDLTGTLMSLKEFKRPTVVAVKHTNPSGIGCGDTIEEAWQKAYDCDDTSIFGGIIAMNRECSKAVAEKIHEIFIEIVCAPSFSQEALAILKKKKNIRILECANLNEVQFAEMKMKEVINGVLVQDKDSLLAQDLEVVSKRQPTQEELNDILFGIKASKHIHSNGVVLVKDEATLGYGFGEVRRSWAVEKAIDRAADKAKGSVLASDGFFFEDTIELLHENGIEVAVSPGGSIKDNNVIELANQYNMVLIFTHTRHFKH